MSSSGRNNNKVFQGPEPPPPAQSAKSGQQQARGRGRRRSVAVAFGRNYYSALSGTTEIPLPLPSGQQQQQRQQQKQENDENSNNNNNSNSAATPQQHAYYWSEPPWQSKHYKGNNNNSHTITDKDDSSQGVFLSDDVDQVVCSVQSTVFLTKTGAVWQTGCMHGHVYPQPTPVTIPLAVKCVQVAAGRHFCVGMMEGGFAAVSWGAGHFGQLGNSALNVANHPDDVMDEDNDDMHSAQQQQQITYTSRPVVMERLLPHVIGSPLAAVAAGDWHGLAVTQAGRVWAWGSNRSQQCGRKPAADRKFGNNSSSSSVAPTLLTPLPVPIDVPIARICAGKSHSVAVCRAGHVYSWGSCVAGQCGLGLTKRSGGIAPPRRVESLVDVQVAAVAAGASHTLAVTTQGRVFSWGSNAEGQLGLGYGYGSSTTSSSSSSSSPPHANKPRLIADLDFVAIYAGQEWKKSQLQQQQQQNASSTTDASSSSTNAKLSAVPRIVQVYAAGSCSAARSSTGAVYVWGSNDVGQLGLAQPAEGTLPYRDNTTAAAAAARSTTGAPSSLRDLHVRTFDSRHNVLLPVRLSGLKSKLSRVRTVACGPNHVWCIGDGAVAESSNDDEVDGTAERQQEQQHAETTATAAAPQSSTNDDSSNNEEIMGRTLYEVQEEHRRKTLLRARKYLQQKAAAKQQQQSQSQSQQPYHSYPIPTADDNSTVHTTATGTESRTTYDGTVTSSSYGAAGSFLLPAPLDGKSSPHHLATKKSTPLSRLLEAQQPGQRPAGLYGAQPAALARAAAGVLDTGSVLDTTSMGDDTLTATPSTTAGASLTTATTNSTSMEHLLPPFSASGAIEEPPETPTQPSSRTDLLQRSASARNMEMAAIAMVTQGGKNLPTQAPPPARVYNQEEEEEEEEEDEESETQHQGENSNNDQEGEGNDDDPTATTAVVVATPSGGDSVEVTSTYAGGGGASSSVTTAVVNNTTSAITSSFASQPSPPVSPGTGRSTRRRKSLMRRLSLPHLLRKRKERNRQQQLQQQATTAEQQQQAEQTTTPKSAAETTTATSKAASAARRVNKRYSM